MIKELPESNGSIIGLEITGKVSLEQEKKLISKIEKIVQEYGKVSVLAILHEGASWGIKAGIEDLKWVTTHIKNINKIAIVSSSNVWKWLVTIDGFFAPLVGIGEKHFKTSDLNDAWAWIREE